MCSDMDLYLSEALLKCANADRVCLADGHHRSLLRQTGHRVLLTKGSRPNGFTLDHGNSVKRSTKKLLTIERTSMTHFDCKLFFLTDKTA